MSEKREENFNFIIPTKEAPWSERTGLLPICSKIIREFMESNLKYAEVKLSHPSLKERKPANIKNSLKYTLKREKNNTVIVRLRNNRIFLGKTE